MLFNSTADEIEAARLDGMVTMLSYFSRALSPDIAHAALLSAEREIGVDLAILTDMGAGRWGANVVPLKCSPDDRAGLAVIACNAKRLGGMAEAFRAHIEEAAEVL